MKPVEKIVVTGLGAVCGAGRSVDEIFDAVQGGRSAVGPIKTWDASRWPANVAAEATVDNRTLVSDRKLHKIISRTDMFGIYAAGEAVRQSGLIPYRDALGTNAAAEFSDGSGIIVGSGGGTYCNSYDYLQLLAVAKGDLKDFGRELAGTVTPMWLLKNLPNNVLCHTGIRHNFKGTNTCITNHSVSGALAVAEAAASMRAGEGDRMVAVGHDTPFEAETVFHFHRLGLLSGDAVRSFDRDRTGTVFGEGAAALVLERETDASARGAAVSGEFLGSGCVNEATGILDVRPDGEGVSRAVEMALADARVFPGDIGMIVAHGNGSRGSDASEALGILRVFGEDCPPVTAFKWAYGHLIAASGILDIVMSLAALRAGVVPGIPTLSTLDPELAPLPVSACAQRPRGDIALVICRGFGGMNAAVVVRAITS